MPCRAAAPEPMPVVRSAARPSMPARWRAAPASSPATPARLSTASRSMPATCRAPQRAVPLRRDRCRWRDRPRRPRCRYGGERRKDHPAIEGSAPEPINLDAGTVASGARIKPGEALHRAPLDAADAPRPSTCCRCAGTDAGGAIGREALDCRHGGERRKHQAWRARRGAHR
jgi:hypothetical protein